MKKGGLHQAEKDVTLLAFSIQLCILESAIKLMRMRFDDYVSILTEEKKNGKHNA